MSEWKHPSGHTVPYEQEITVEATCRNSAKTLAARHPITNSLVLRKFEDYNFMRSTVTLVEKIENMGNKD